MKYNIVRRCRPLRAFEIRHFASCMACAVFMCWSDTPRPGGANGSVSDQRSLAGVIFFICAILFAAPSFAGTAASKTSDQLSADEGPSNRPVLQDGKTGRVGIGTAVPQAALDVYGGEIKIGSSGAACRALLAGTIRFAHSKLQFCDGTSWRNVSLDKAE